MRRQPLLLPARNLTPAARRATLDDMDAPAMEPFRIFLYGGPATTISLYRSHWDLSIPGGGIIRTVTEPPDHVWLWNIWRAWMDWRVHLEEPTLKRFCDEPAAALYWLEHNRDGTPRQTPDGAYVYAHVPDAEIDHYLDRT